MKKIIIALSVFFVFSAQAVEFPICSVDGDYVACRLIQRAAVLDSEFCPNALQPYRCFLDIEFTRSGEQQRLWAAGCTASAASCKRAGFDNPRPACLLVEDL